MAEGVKFWPVTEQFDPESADSEGLVAIGGDLEPETLLSAYRHGVFPWFDEGMPFCWWSPDPRAVIEFDKFHVSRRLARTIRSGRFTTTINRDFIGVMRGCAVRDEGTWITDDMLAAYARLHALGVAHSVEVWLSTGFVAGSEVALGDRRPGSALASSPGLRSPKATSDPATKSRMKSRLVGGVYGVAIGGFFAAESMFHRATDASKVALAALVEHLRQRGFHLLDIQLITPHTTRMGATEIPRGDYLSRLATALSVPTTFLS
ncbi:MAG: leucyl/phenylalanyl-tRNA--protein transferase [Gemmataceae bacterium]